MTLDNARVTLVELYRQNAFLRGFLHARGAWANGCPILKDNPEEHAALINVLRELTNALEQEKTTP